MGLTLVLSQPGFIHLWALKKKKRKEGRSNKKGKKGRKEEGIKEKEGN